jgi:hypothetical protein
MRENNSDSPKWRLVYLLVAASLLVSILLLFIFTRYYQ